VLICQISDLHIEAFGRKSYRGVDTTASLEHCISTLRALPQAPDVIVATGDLVDGGRAEEYAALALLLNGLAAPVYLLPGNHDERANLCAAFPDHAYLPRGGRRLHYVIEDFPVRMIALDTVIPGTSGGMVDAATLDWLERILAEARARPTLIMMHHPPFLTGIGHMDEIGLSGAAAFGEVIARHPQVERIICGHLHRSITTRFAGTVASICPSPAHQVMLDLAADAQARYVMEPPGFQLHLWQGAGGLVSHTVAIGEFAGPYLFSEDEDRIG
jgi:3',5'-cyclic AMP phosphodiesterase CpdA